MSRKVTMRMDRSVVKGRRASKKYGGSISGHWLVRYLDPITGKDMLMTIPSSSSRSVRQILADIGVDIGEAVVDFIRA